MRTLQGTIVSNKMTRTVVVRVDRLRQHPKYLKMYRVSRKYKAHTDDAGAYALGDIVRIQESRPYSKEKRWRVIEIVKAARDRAATDEEISVGENSDFESEARNSKSEIINKSQ